MANIEGSHFPLGVLDIAERAQQAAGHTRAGRAVTRLIAGSRSPAYQQLDWRSRYVKRIGGEIVVTPADPDAGKLPRSWDRAAILAAPAEEIARLKEEVDGPHQEALAYMTNDVTHVGTREDAAPLFSELPESEGEVAVAMRLGRAPLRAAMGLWLPADRIFLGAQGPYLAESFIDTTAIATEYPGIALA
jgi:hypothetical protein